MSFTVTLRSDVRDLWHYSTAAPLSKRMWPWTLDKTKAHKFATRLEAVQAAVILKKEIPYPNKIEVVEE